MIRRPEPSTTGRCHQFAPVPPTMSSTKLPHRTEAVLSRRQVEGLIADGRCIIIVDQRVLKVDPWLKYHPGGAKAIMHMVGRDATDEVNGYCALCSIPSLACFPDGPCTDFTRPKPRSIWRDIKSVE